MTHIHPPCTGATPIKTERPLRGQSLTCCSRSRQNPITGLKMGFFSFCGVKLLVFVILLGLVAATEPTKSSSERRGLRNVIRVGKRYGEEELWDFPSEEKRFGKMMAFPRVGRSSSSGSTDDDESTEKRSGSNGMWFGPRIGRSPPKISSKNRDDAMAWAYILLKNESPLRHLLNNDPRQASENVDDYGSDEFNKGIISSY